MEVSKSNITNMKKIPDGEYKTVIKNIEEKFINSSNGRKLHVLEFQLSIFVDNETINEINILHFINEENQDYKNFVYSLFENYSTNSIDFDKHVNTVVRATIFKNSRDFYVLKSYKPFSESMDSRFNDFDDSDLSDLTIDISEDEELNG